VRIYTFTPPVCLNVVVLSLKKAQGQLYLLPLSYHTSVSVVVSFHELFPTNFCMHSVVLSVYVQCVLRVNKQMNYTLNYFVPGSSWTNRAFFTIHKSPIFIQSQRLSHLTTKGLHKVYDHASSSNSGQNQNIRTDNESFENVSTFKYLGTTLTDQNDIHDEI
jgi:hypothetical protein